MKLESKQSVYKAQTHIEVERVKYTQRKIVEKRKQAKKNEKNNKVHGIIATLTYTLYKLIMTIFVANDAWSP